MVLNFIKSGFAKVKNALSKTRSFLGSQIQAIFSGKIDEEALESLEKLFYEADLGLKTAAELTEKVRKLHLNNPSLSSEEILAEIKKELLAILEKNASGIATVVKEKSPLVLLIVGVNGNGKTTSVAKLAKKMQQDRKSVLIAAADTFRAAATEQLETWAMRLKTDIVKGTPKTDPSSITFDAITAAKAREKDVVIIDTAGRLHTKVHLMQELEKLKRTCQKLHPESPHETLLVLDATTGQNAIDQAKTFSKFIPLTGLILTKLDGSAKGGIAISISRELDIPVKFIGVGEGVDDLEPFDAKTFVDALFD